MECTDMEIRHLPGFSTIMKAVLKSQIQQLVSQLAKDTNEEALVITACLEDETFSSFGSEAGLDFIKDDAELKASFLGFCMKRKYRQMLAKGQGQKQDTEKTESSACPHVQDKSYTPALTINPHPVTLCKVSNSGHGVVRLEQQKWPYHGQQNSPGKSKSLVRERLKPYKAKGPQKNQINSNRCLNSRKSPVNSDDSEDNTVDYLKDKDSNFSAPGLRKEDCDQLIKVEDIDECEDELDTGTTVEDTAGVSYQSAAHLFKKASASVTRQEFGSESVSVTSFDLCGISSETGSAPKNPIENKCTSNTISMPQSEAVQSELSPSSNSQVSCGSVNVSIKLETPYMYDQEESTGGAEDNSGIKDDKMQHSTHSSHSCKSTETKGTGNDPEEKKNFLCIDHDFGDALKDGRKLPLTTMASGEDEIIDPCEETFVSIPDEKFLCATCGKRFERKFSFQRHVRIHDDTKTFKCIDCDKSYNSRYDFDNHKRSKHGDEKITCDTCGKTFSYKQSLLQHAKRCNSTDKRTDDQDTKCTRCDYKGKKNDLQVHVAAKHMEQYPFLCKHCGKKFKWRSSLAYHSKHHEK